MKAGSEILVVLLSVSIFLLLLFVFIVSLPRLFQRKDPELKHFKPDAIEGAFRALADEIRSLKEQLIMKERLAALGEISAGIAHEFRNPMGVIAGYARLLLKSFEETDKRREATLGILREIEEMDKFVEELLKFRNSEPLNKSNINLTKFIKDVIVGMSNATNRIDFSWSSPVMIMADETLLKQAVRNLIQNALDAGNRVWINIEKGKSNGKDGVYVVIRDDGRGIPESDLNRIFMPFYTTKSKGSGIGLALAQKIAIGHGGNISVKSTEGQGSVFRLFLPEE